MFTDAHKVKLIDDCYYEVEGKHTSMNNDIDPSLLGANASAEGEDADDQAESSSISGVDVCLYNKLQEFPMDKKGLTGWFKGYLKKIIEFKTTEEVEGKRWSESDVADWKVRVTNFYKLVAGKIGKGDVTVFVGESFDTKASYAFLEWRETDQGEVPIVMFIKDGLKEQKQ